MNNAGWIKHLTDGLRSKDCNFRIRIEQSFGENSLSHNGLKISGMNDLGWTEHLPDVVSYKHGECFVTEFVTILIKLYGPLVANYLNRVHSITATTNGSTQY